MALASYFFLFISILTFHYYSISLYALKVHLGGDTGLNLSKVCSKTCESSFCKVPPLLRYGKYCGILYSGCPGEKPCDELDACCMKHDACISANNKCQLGFAAIVILFLPLVVFDFNWKVLLIWSDLNWKKSLVAYLYVATGLLIFLDKSSLSPDATEDWPVFTETGPNNNYLSEVCNKGLLDCVQRFKKAGSRTFKGNTCDVNDVTTTISAVMDAAVIAGRYINKP